MSGFWWFLLGSGFTAGAVFFLCRLRQKHRKQRLLALTDYLGAASVGKETVLAFAEDEFSLLEDEIYKTVGELRIAREREQKEHLRQADNLADIAHQLKTPLTSLSLLTQLLASAALAGQQEYIRRIDSQIGRLEWLTSSLLTMSRLDAGTIDFSPVSIDFEELAARAAEPIEQALCGKSQSMKINGGSSPIVCDPYWTAEALLNLIKNCSEYTPSGGQISMNCNITLLYAQITVEDNGPGFDPAEIPCLFRRFYRGKHTSKNSTGIGLSLSRAIVEGQGGMIRAENCPLGGARFVIRFYP